MSKRKPEELGEKDIGLITPDIARQHESATVLLARQNKLLDGVIDAHSALRDLESHLDAEIHGALYRDVLDINEKLTKTFVTPKDQGQKEAASAQGLRDLQTLAVLRAEKNSAAEAGETIEEQPIFFSSDDLAHAKEARTLEAESGGWWQAKVSPKLSLKGLVEKRQTHTDFKAKLQGQNQLREHHEQREKHRDEMAQKVTDTISTEQLAALEKQLQNIQTILEIIDKSHTTIAADKNGATESQRIKAEQCMVAVHEYATTPIEERSFEPVTKAFAELKLALDIKRLTAKAQKRVERMILDLKEQMADARKKGTGIVELFKALPMAGRLNQGELEGLYGKVETASGKVEAAYQAVTATVSQVLERLKQGAGNPSLVEGLVTTIENGNLKELYLSSFNIAMTELNEAVEALGKLLNLRPAKELTAHGAVKGILPKRSDIHIREGELANVDNEINAEAVREAGLIKKELRAFPEANQLINEIVEKKLNPGTTEGQKQLCDMWSEDCPPPFVPPEGKWWHKFYPETPYPEAFSQDQRKKGTFWYVEQLYAGTIVANLEGEKQPFVPEYGEQTVFVPSRPDEDWDATTGKQKKLQTEDYNDKLLNLLLAVAKKEPHIGAVNISRETIDNLLWLGDPGERIPSAMQAKVLKTLTGDNWKNWEIRNANQREIEGKHNLWTHMDGYFLGGGGGRYGLLGGYRKYGGASRVAYYWRDRAAGNCAVRLVLSRKRG